MRKIVVQTQRLRIMPHSMEEMSSMHEMETDPHMKQAYQSMMRTMRQLPGREEWGSNWAICLASGEAIGGIGFKGAPDSEGIVEIGYGIDEAYQRMGYAAEAVAGMVSWARAQDGVRCIHAQTEADNLASQKVLLKNGFVQDGFGVEGPLFKIAVLA